MNKYCFVVERGKGESGELKRRTFLAAMRNSRFHEIFGVANHIVMEIYNFNGFNFPTYQHENISIVDCYHNFKNKSRQTN